MDGEDDDNLQGGNTANTANTVKGPDNAINGSCSVSSVCEHTKAHLSKELRFKKESGMQGSRSELISHVPILSIFILPSVSVSVSVLKSVGIICLPARMFLRLETEVKESSPLFTVNSSSLMKIFEISVTTLSVSISFSLTISFSFSTSISISTSVSVLVFSTESNE